MMAASNRDALLALFHATDGTNWHHNHMWGTDAELRLWYGVEVNDQGRVKKLLLAHNHLQGMVRQRQKLLFPTCTTHTLWFALCFS